MKTNISQKIQNESNANTLFLSQNLSATIYLFKKFNGLINQYHKSKFKFYIFLNIFYPIKMIIKLIYNGCRMPIFNDDIISKFILFVTRSKNIQFCRPQIDKSYILGLKYKHIFSLLNFVSSNQHRISFEV